jgi:hypothetical protein
MIKDLKFNLSVTGISQWQECPTIYKVFEKMSWICFKPVSEEEPNEIK